MENNPLSNHKKNTNRVSPYSKSIDINSTRKLEINGDNPQLETVENEIENGLKSKTTENFNVLNRSMTKTLYHKISSVPHTQETVMNTFCNKSKILYLSKVNRVLILLKVLSSIIYFIASPVSLIILVQELLGYTGVRFLRQCLTLLYGMSLFITLILRIIVSIFLGFDYAYLDLFYIAVLALTTIFTFLDCAQVYYVFKLYNEITSLDSSTKHSYLVAISRTCIPP